MLKAILGGGLLAAALSSGACWAGASEARPSGESFRDCTDCPLMVVIPAGSFDMGSPEGDRSGEGDEFPQHRVTIREPFAAGAHEITRGEFERFVKATGHNAGNECQVHAPDGWKSSPGTTWRNPGFAQTERDPVVCVSWEDAQAYVKWLSKLTAKPYRLLSESEWEYLARAGVGEQLNGDPSKAAGDSGGATHRHDSAPVSTPTQPAISHELANYGAEECCAPLEQGRDRWKHSAPVGSFPPNAFGVYDVLGNVWEWLADCYNDSYRNAPADGRARTTECSHPDRRSLRGGSWGDSSALLRPAYRLRGPPDGRYITLGFRIARALD